MHSDLARALEPVLRDIAATGAPKPVVVDEDWDPMPETASAGLRSLDGSGTGVNIVLDSTFAEQVARVADMVQEWVIEELWSSSTNWPRCPRHPISHPLVADASTGVARWRCPTTSGVDIEVGTLE